MARTLEDILTFEEYCASLGMTPEEHRKLSETTADLIKQPHDDLVCIGQMRPKGEKCVQAMSSFAVGTYIGLAIDWQKHRTDIIGRFVNHSAEPSARFVAAYEGVGVAATRYLHHGQEVTIDYRTIPLIDWKNRVISY